MNERKRKKKNFLIKFKFMAALHGKHLFWFSKALNYTTQGDHKKGF